MRGHAGKSVLALTQYDRFALAVLIYDSRGACNIRWPRNHCEADLVPELLVGRGSWLQPLFQGWLLNTQGFQSGELLENITRLPLNRIETRRMAGYG